MQTSRSVIATAASRLDSISTKLWTCDEKAARVDTSRTPIATVSSSREKPAAAEGRGRAPAACAALLIGPQASKALRCLDVPGRAAVSLPLEDL